MEYAFSRGISSIVGMVDSCAVADTLEDYSRYLRKTRSHHPELLTIHTWLHLYIIYHIQSANMSYFMNYVVIINEGKLECAMRIL